jgi:hypothetical protein
MRSVSHIRAAEGEKSRDQRQHGQGNQDDERPWQS